MPLIRLLVSVGGDLAGHDSPPSGSIIDVPEPVARAWCDGVRAVRVDQPPARETATTQPPERRQRQRQER